MKKRTVALLCAAVMLLGVVFGGTMALLSHSSTPLTNTFTTADINLTLAETTGQDYIMAPGAVLKKDPTVTVAEGSASCWLFVKVEELNNDVPEGQRKKPVAWEIADEWTKVKVEDETVYYRTYTKDGQKDGQNVFPVLKDNQVTISDELTQAYMKSKDAKPQLIFTAYAIQQDWLKNEDGQLITDPAQAWALAKTQTTANVVTPEAQQVEA